MILFNHSYSITDQTGYYSAVYTNIFNNLFLSLVLYSHDSFYLFSFPLTINTGSARYIPELAMIELHKIYLYIIISLEGENQRFIKITQAGPVSMDTNPDSFSHRGGFTGFVWTEGRLV